MVKFRKSNGDIEVYDEERDAVLFRNPEVMVIGKIEDFYYDENGQLVITNIKVKDVSVTSQSSAVKNQL